MFQSVKVYDGFSVTFRQWRAKGTHCRFIHGYATSFRVVFQGDLDERNWVFDFGGMKRSKTLIDGKTPKDWMDYMFDHTMIIAHDDPEMELFKLLDKKEVIQLRVLAFTGAEMFAEYIFRKLQHFIEEETNHRVKIVSVELMENGKNSAVYKQN